VTDDRLHEALLRQYRAALAMFKQAVELCPEERWLSPDCPNKFWHIAYHALFFTHLYLHPSEAEFTPWPKHRPNYQFLGAIPWPPHERPRIDAPYTRPEILEFHEFCGAEIDSMVRSLALDAPSGFSWLKFSRLEVHLYSIRHTQHHIGQLVERLRTGEDVGVRWAGMG